MQLQYEILAIVLTGIIAFASGMRKAKSSCCCCAFEMDRDVDNKLQSVRVVRKGASMREREPTPTPSWWNLFTFAQSSAASDIQEGSRRSLDLARVKESSPTKSRS
tara:strand:- start:844 stop:1161 length:318 start_codon:yes stop_codon:yes gene_type:complete